MAKLEVVGKINNTKSKMYNPSYVTWSEDEIKELQENYSYHSEHKKEAENKFHRKWSVIRAKALKSGFSTLRENKKWSEEHLKELKEKYFYYVEHKKEAETIFQRNWSAISVNASTLGITSRKINKRCSRFLGEHISERVLSYVFRDVERMPHNNKGYDFICNKGYKVEVKSSCLHRNMYSFKLNQNKIADYFLLIGFDNREDLNPQHIWLIKGNLVDEIKTLSITNSEPCLLQMYEYELTDKLKETIECCNELKNNF